METPFPAVPDNVRRAARTAGVLDNVRRAARTAGVLAKLSGNPSQAVVACVKRDTSLDREELPAAVHWRTVSEADLGPGQAAPAP